MNKPIIISLISILIISISANIYFINKSETSDNNLIENKELKDQKKLKDEKKESKDEENKVVTEKNGTESINQLTQNQVENNFEKDEKFNKNLINAAERFIEYTYNVTSENYALLKRNANNYMTDDLVEVLFASDGIDENQINVKTSVKDIKIYSQADNNKQAVVYYASTIEYLNNGYKDQSENYVLMDFVESDGKIKVKNLMPINNIRGV